MSPFVREELTFPRVGLTVELTFPRVGLEVVLTFPRVGLEVELTFPRVGLLELTFPRVGLASKDALLESTFGKGDFLLGATSRLSKCWR
jgi:hypothetical protein